MKLVIDIPDYTYEGLRDCAGTITVGESIVITKAIRNGTPLPKGHGDLIDRSTLEPDTEWSEWYDGWVSYSYGQIADADIVIEADGGGEDADNN